jgi:hypothetical protein
VLLQLLADAQLAPPVVGTPLLQAASHLVNHLQTPQRQQGSTRAVIAKPTTPRTQSSHMDILCHSRAVVSDYKQGARFFLQCLVQPESPWPAAYAYYAWHQALPAAVLMPTHPLCVRVLLHAAPPGSQLGPARKHVPPAKVARQDVGHEHKGGEQR